MPTSAKPALRRHRQIVQEHRTRPVKAVLRNGLDIGPVSDALS